MSRERVKRAARVSVKMGVFPLLVYFACFCAITYPAVRRFSTHLFGLGGDGLQNVWNLWWVHKAIIQLHTSPWYTRYLHWPFGISLLGHTLNPFNGFVTLFFSNSMSLTRAYNLVVIFSFVVGGLTAFLLAYDLTGSYGASLLGGFIFTFSSFHFAHTEDGHLNMVSLEWIPLFLLLWFKLISKPKARVATGAAVALFLVILCDYYFFFYCVLAALIMLGCRAMHERNAFFFARKEFRVPLGVFSMITLATSGVLAGSVLLANHRDPLLGAHAALVYSLDLLSPFVYGAFWRFSSLTVRYWSQFSGGMWESSAHLGLSVLFLLVYVWRRRKSGEAQGTGLWFFIIFFFLVLALGPVLRIRGEPVLWLTLPYSWLEKVFPPLRLSGVPGRMMVMAYLSAGVISAAGFKSLLQGSRRSRGFAGVLAAVLVVEYLPRPVVMTPFPIPEYVQVLKSLPGNQGVLDHVSSKYSALLYQTVHEKPLAFGYLARVPTSVDAKDRELTRAIEDGRFSSLWHDYHIRYVVSKDPPPGLRDSPSAKIVWSNGQVWIFDLAPERPIG